MEQYPEQHYPPPAYSTVIRETDGPQAVQNLVRTDHVAAAVVNVADNEHIENVPQAVAEPQLTHNLIEVSHSSFHEWKAGPNKHTSRKHCMDGLIHIMHTNKKHPRHIAKHALYKLGLLSFYLVNFVCQIVAVIVIMKGKHISYYLTHIVISLAGLIYKSCIILSPCFKCCSCKDQDDNEERQPIALQAPDSRTRGTNENEGCTVFLDYVVNSFAELLIFPSLICSLFGFINEKSWELDRDIQIINFSLLLYNLIIDAVYWKIYFLWLLYRIMRKSYRKYDILRGPHREKRCPVFFAFLMCFAIMTSVLHWLMLGIVGLRIYVDNFSIENSDMIVTEPSIGSYTSSHFTWYMMVCTAYLPFISWIAVVLLNKYWFYEIYSLIKQVGKHEINIEAFSSKAKIIASVKHYSSLISMFLILPFIAFAVGMYLPDYSEDEAPNDTKDLAKHYGPYFIILFALTNIQTIVVFILMIFALPVLIFKGVKWLLSQC